MDDYEEIMRKCDPEGNIMESISISAITYNVIMLILIITLWWTGYASKLPLAFWFTFIIIYVLSSLVIVIFGMLHGFIEYSECRDALMFRRIKELERRCTCKNEG